MTGDKICRNTSIETPGGAVGIGGGGSSGGGYGGRVGAGLDRGGNNCPLQDQMFLNTTPFGFERNKSHYAPGGADAPNRFFLKGFLFFIFFHLVSS